MNKMLIVAIAVCAVSGSAYADGFVCQARNASLTVKAYNHTHAVEGTRSGAVVVLSDPEASAGEKTIARFTDAKGTLSSHGADYVANVDLRFKDQSNKEALVAGKVQLEDLDTVELSVDFSYSQPIAAGESVDGTIILNTRDGNSISLDASCERYLKN